MDHYLDIQVEPDIELSAPALLNNLFAKFHRTVAQTCKGQIAVSFPKQQKTLGNTLRLHGSYHHLSILMEQPWLKGLRDYTQVGSISPVPESILGYRTVSRVQKKSPQNMRKRSIKKGWLSAGEAIHRIPDTAQSLLALPYLQLRSLSNKNVMRIYIKLGEVSQTQTAGEFSSYGLSRTATIPWF
ncbi:type I-F CRISPR-associated endoribonuclease Cas6/Csy4 [Vibrio sp. SCSIO 43132]|uniref:type I-F CRISPR-associated endoribonuclease Cas6/Csy4 n=1 Tax=Vibrio sp. SCSIO 43132 TaxID=2779363 RepID=UPI001CA94368|nr:type I-F CRISPR-associated endoribonuclease Cas6/Csy4 [Vibrio sp. SCSIO 43132]UAB71341.1 type I-F CRISPR-associated endoribonuclease Cas6/Csy4 [Vibrio sp. SCSIO 43132]